MRIRAIAVVCLALVGAIGRGQEPPRVYRFNFIRNPQSYQQAADTIRTIVGIANVSVDARAGELTVTASAEQLAAVDWLFPQLDAAPGSSDAPSYAMSGGAETLRVFHLLHAESPADLQEIVNVVRTIAAMNYAFPFWDARALAVRGPEANVTLVAWLIAQLDAAAPSSTTQIAANRLDIIPGPEVRVAHLVHAATAEALQGVVNTLRSMADINRVFPHNRLHAIAMRGEPDRIAVAEWLVGQLDQAPGEQGPEPHEMPLSGETVRVFYFAHLENRAIIEALVNAIRATANLQRVYSGGHSRSIVVRGAEEQLKQAAALIAQYDK